MFSASICKDTNSFRQVLAHFQQLASNAYLDGKHPSVVMCRGYNGRSVLAAWDWRNGQLSQRWVFDTDDGYEDYAGQGNLLSIIGIVTMFAKELFI